MRMHCPSRESTTKALTRSAPGLGGFGGLPRQGHPESHQREQLQQVCSGLGRGVLGTNGQVGLVGLGLGPLLAIFACEVWLFIACRQESLMETAKVKPAALRSVSYRSSNRS